MARPRSKYAIIDRVAILAGALLGVAAGGMFALPLLWWAHNLERGPEPKTIPLSDFHTPEQLADEVSKSAGTRIETGPGWWSVEVTQPVTGPFGETVPCRRYVRTIADGKTQVVPGDWRYSADGARTCRYPASAEAPS
ncbi:Uncharacterised protein (plasmid) [Tsukamurella tyrosinosolvens]|uniref:Uncharacterized protein n=1 Tax=Tsukamurella tyrosinosolvens TaxID=57704 RepID=A0A1H4U4R2_TSUTY|nr:hypothetical protein [Tsukamurella tyrosinosolvens]KXO93022.1 hypothetical protein AXK58_14220 [Tsukamurella tyrosinosolvens]SEC63712.1 hypothetical protein SAMN04489793_2786 [Tsukamurella tyrosinosolvens]VEH94000.1 Uncharacterised protein [Tsukamurella tyrosinosolvens]